MLLTENISPAKLKAMSPLERLMLCEEIRSLLVSVVSKNGGHLASNLGSVELIIALHSVFTTPRDKLVFDVGHQAYTHKILTGRRAAFENLRRENGISGFPRPSESEHDAFIGGHAGVSVSAALGIAAAKKLRGEDGSVVAVAGDGAFTNGEVYEGLNNAGKRAGSFIVILNDNGMCISKSSGALAAYLSQIRRAKKYYEAKSRVKNLLGKEISGLVKGTKRIVKSALIPDNLFENLGFKYFGLIDGHNLEELISVLELVKTLDKPCLVHIKTKKGKGYFPAEQNAGEYHGLDKINPESKKAETYSDVFGREIMRLGAENPRICLITAAMKYATGCNYFAKRFPARFFDAGIAEAHAATFAAGLASGNMLPVFAVYSTFLQRCFDQLVHDTAIEKLRLVLAIDRAGLNSEDGETHQGTFDVGLISLIPNTVIYSPFTANELRLCLRKAVYDDAGISAVRYPRGLAYDPPGEESYKDFELYCRERSPLRSANSQNNAGKLIITYGRPAKLTLSLLRHGADVLRLVKIHPLPEDAYTIIKGYDDITFFEESSLKGGIAERLSARLIADGGAPVQFRARGVEGFVPFADLERQFKLCGLDIKSMREFAGL